MLFDRNSCACNQDVNMLNHRADPVNIDIDVENAIDMNQMGFQNQTMNVQQPMVGGYMQPASMGCKMGPVCEAPIEKCIHREIVHEVPHVCPINTRIINHHIYKHTYAPQYSCCEENQVSNVQCGSCCNFQ